jgi:hypothetical protein
MPMKIFDAALTNTPSPSHAFFGGSAFAMFSFAFYLSHFSLFSESTVLSKLHIHNLAESFNTFIFNHAF